MFPFFFFGAVHHILIVAVVAFFVLFAAGKSDGFVKILGNVLGYLLLIAAVLMIVCAAFGPMLGGQWHDKTGWMHPGWAYHLQAPAPAAQPAPPPSK
jgi:hypothetical protein